MAALRVEEDGIRLGGGAKAAEAKRVMGGLTVRERIALLVDPMEGSETVALSRDAHLSAMKLREDGAPCFRADVRAVEKQVLRFAPG